MPERETLSLVIVGHVDHGKSTLIGRLLLDTESLPAGKLEEVRRATAAGNVELAHIMDALEEERTQMMTIDTAQAFFKSARRDYAIIDAPGHRELTKNMITGASRAEAALLVVDGAEGMQEQTRRHAYFLSLLGIGQVAVLINKMDTISYDRKRFEQVVAEVCKFCDTVGLKPSQIIPGSAMAGDNIVKPSERMAWYAGPTVMEVLEEFHTDSARVESPLRFPIQDVYPHAGKRIYVGRVESGQISAGQKIVFLPSGATASVKAIEVFEESRKSAGAGECIGIILDSDLTLDRGEVACAAEQPPKPTRRFRANLFWMWPEPFRVGDNLTVRVATQECRCKLEKIEQRMDSSTLAVLEENAMSLGDTEVGRVVLSAEKPIVLDAVGEVPELGRFVIAREMDAEGGGIIISAADVLVS